MRRRDFLRSIATIAGITLLPSPLLTIQADNAPFDVYLTFDDGPFPALDMKTGPTDVVIQTLKDHGVKATFFLHGRHILKWHGPTLVRYITEGHAIGNHLWSQGGNTTLDKPTFTRLAYQYLLTEIKIRDMLQQTDQDAYNRYLIQGKLFRRPGGSSILSEFLLPANFQTIEYDPLIRPLGDYVQWIKSIYDYSGWHVNGGESIPPSIRPNTPDQERSFILRGRNGYYGVLDYLSVGNPPQRSIEANQGLIILMHDADSDTDAMLPDLLKNLSDLGAQFKALPRPIDKPNSKTVGISRPPTVPKM